MSRVIKLPKSLDYNVTQLSRLRNEVAGGLLYDCASDTVLAMRVFGVGACDRVQVDPLREAAFEETVSRYSGYALAGFHTHPSGNKIASPADLAYFSDKLRQDCNYFHIIARPNGYSLMRKGQGGGLISIQMVRGNSSLNSAMKLASSRLDHVAEELSVPNRRWRVKQ